MMNKRLYLNDGLNSVESDNYDVPDADFRTYSMKKFYTSRDFYTYCTPGVC